MHSFPHPESASCTPCADRWTARAQPWLGTLVEIALPAADATDARFAAGFAAIAHVHRRMSAHDSRSDVVRIARLAHRGAVTVDPETWAVLRLAQSLWRETRGLFDPVVAPAPRGRFPVVATMAGARNGGMDALRLEPCNRVGATRPVAFDLGGIAKGHAVDRAVAALRGSGATAGRVNAGGDLRVFGADGWTPIRVRLPDMHTLAVHLFDLRDAAAATSADYFRGARGALVASYARRPRRIEGSITVAAPTCALADALTKIVALVPHQAPAILARHAAHAFRLGGGTRGGNCTTTCTAATAHLRLPTQPAA